MDNSFQLNQSEHESIYSKIIEPTSFLDTSSVDQPRLVLVGGQTGAGKSNIVKLSIQEFNAGNVVIVNTDDLRAYHPRYDEIVHADDKLSAERTHQDASAWKNKLLSRCIETRRNIILEGVFKDSTGLMEVIETARQAGYSVVLRIVAVHERYSVWGINRRYEKERIVRGHGRYVPIAYHDECYLKLPNSVHASETQICPDRIEIFDRNGTLIFDNELIEGRWKQEPNAVATIERERARKLTAKERDDYLSSWTRVFEYMHKRGADKQEIAQVRALADRFEKELQSESG